MYGQFSRCHIRFYLYAIFVTDRYYMAILQIQKILLTDTQKVLNIILHKYLLLVNIFITVVIHKM